MHLAPMTLVAFLATSATTTDNDPASAPRPTATAPSLEAAPAAAPDTNATTNPFLLGVTAGVGVDGYAKMHGGLTVDLALTAARRIDTFDAGILALARYGLEVLPDAPGGLTGEVGAAAVLGNTFSFDRGHFIRVAGGYGVVRAFHPGNIETTPHFALAEVRLGAEHELPRWSTYLRAHLPLGSFSDVPEHRAVSVSAGVSISN